MATKVFDRLGRMACRGWWPPCFCVAATLILVHTVGITQEIGPNDFLLSDAGGLMEDEFWVNQPDVAYNSVRDEYLVVWYGTDDTGLLDPDDEEIFVQRFDAATGAEVGINDSLISDMGGIGTGDGAAAEPAVAYAADLDRYLVVWTGNEGAGAGDEIYGQLLDGLGNEVGPNDFRISEMGPDNQNGWRGRQPDLVYNPDVGEFLVVWSGVDDADGQLDSEFEIFVRRVDPTSGALLSTDLRISDAGGVGEAFFDAFDPAVAYNPTDGEYLVVWSGDDDLLGGVSNEFEIFVQRVDGATGAEVGSNDVRISTMGPSGSTQYGAFLPAVAYGSATNRYLVVWSGDDTVSGLINNEIEIFGQLLDGDAQQVGGDDFRISDMGGTGSTAYAAGYVDVAYSHAASEFLVVWEGNDDTLLDINETEIWGQRIAADSGAERGPNDFRLSDAGPDGNGRYDAIDPAVAWRGTVSSCVIVWYGSDDADGQLRDELEVRGQLLRLPLFADSFEAGDLLAWSESMF